jgi:hypothetical protein
MSSLVPKTIATMKALEHWLKFWEGVPRYIRNSYLTDKSSAKEINEMLHWDNMLIPKVSGVERLLIGSNSLVLTQKKNLFPPISMIIPDAEITMLVKSNDSSHFYELFVIKKHHITFNGIYRIDNSLYSNKSYIASLNKVV